MDKHERVQAALRREPVDRLPLSLWRHEHRADRSPQDLAAATLALARDYDLDLVKLTPSGLYAVEDWAGETIVYPGTEHDPPFLARPAIADPAGWRSLAHRDPGSGALGRELETVRRVATALGGDRPLVMTVFSPLTLAYKLAGAAVIRHQRENPDLLHAGLQVLAETTAAFVQAALDAGAGGLFFATQLAGHDWLTPAEYDEFGRAYDLAVLEPATGTAAIVILHLHGRDVFFHLADDYPVGAVSWHNWETAPDLATASRLTRKALVTGLDRELLGSGPTTAIQAQVRQVMAQTGGRGLVLAPSCVIPTTAPAAHLRAVRDAVTTGSQQAL